MAEAKPMTPREQRLVSYVTAHTDKWRTHRDTNYLENWNTYERLWGGIWSAEERTRDSERARVVTPVLQAAVENYQAELDEAIFGQGDEFFDLTDDIRDQDKADAELLKKGLKEEFKINKLRSAMSECILNSAVYGTAIAELVMVKETRSAPATEPTAAPGTNLIGAVDNDYVCVKVHPVHPRNFIIDPAARQIRDALAVAIEEFVPAFSVYEMMESGAYIERELEKAETDSDLETYQEDEVNDADRIKLLRWYGKVPRNLLTGKKDEDDAKDALDSLDYTWMYDDLVEAIIVIANDGILLKAEETPYMMKDRPVIAWQADIRPGRFWGRGICEKGASMQKVIDSQLRAHLDFSALTAVPMVGIDATRMPRGFKFEVRPGRSIFTNGNPNESLMPFKLGDTSPMNVETANLFERLLMMSTNTLDSAGIPSVNSEGGQDALAAIIKKNKRTLTSFQDSFLIPLIESTAWRYMQFDPNRFPVKDFKFVPVSTLGVMARSYETKNYLAMMSTLGPDSPVLPMLLTGVLETSSLSNRDELIQQIQQSMQPSPEAQQMQQMQMQMLQLQAEEQQLKNAKLQAEINKITTETELYPEKVRGELIAALTKNSEEADEFGQRVKIAELALKEQELSEKAADRQSNEKISQFQAISAHSAKQSELQQKEADKQREAEEKEKDRELKREEIRARKAEKSITRTKDGYSVKNKE